MSNLDISKYVAEQYIFLKTKNFMQYGGGASAGSIFDKSFSEMRKNLLKMESSDIAANKKLASIMGGLDDAESALELFNEAVNGNLLELCMDDVATGINNAISKIIAESGFDISAIANSVYANYATMLSSGRERLEAEKLNKFFETIEMCLKKMQGDVSGGFTQELLRLKNKYLKGGNAPSIVSEDELTKAETLIRNYLEAAANRLEANGAVGPASFRGTISNIFNTVLCESIVGDLLVQAVQEGLFDIEAALMGHVFKNTNIKVIDVKYTNRSFDKGLGQKKTEQGHVSKVDLTGPGPLEITIQSGDKIATIEIGLNVSAKQVLTTGKGRNPSWLKGNVHIVQSNIGKLFSKSSDVERYYGYNTIVHRGGMRGAYNSFRKFIAASFFVEWLIGTGQQIANSPVVDTAQYFIINSRLYSMATTMRNVCERMLSGNSPVTIEISNKAVNKRVGKVSDDVSDARIRSNAVREAINTITISATLNKGIINQYIT